MMCRFVDLSSKPAWRPGLEVGLHVYTLSSGFRRERSQGYKVTFDAMFWQPFPQDILTYCISANTSDTSSLIGPTDYHKTFS